MKLGGNPILLGGKSLRYSSSFTGLLVLCIPVSKPFKIYTVDESKPVDVIVISWFPCCNRTDENAISMLVDWLQLDLTLIEVPTDEHPNIDIQSCFVTRSEA